jgi:hypothetical protein
VNNLGIRLGYKIHQKKKKDLQETTSLIREWAPKYEYPRVIGRAREVAHIHIPHAKIKSGRREQGGPGKRLARSGHLDCFTNVNHQELTFLNY